MRAPVKLNDTKSFARVFSFLPSMSDPRLLGTTKDDIEFAKAASALKFGRTFKTTSPNRFLMTLKVLRDIPFDTKPIVLDVGASVGITSLDVISSVAFQKYYVADLNTKVYLVSHGSWTYFLDAKGFPLLAANDFLIVYPDVENAVSPLGSASRLVFSPKVMEKVRKKEPICIDLICPSLTSPGVPGVNFVNYNVFDVWTEGKVDLVIAANLLNRVYFTETQLRSAFASIRETLEGDGWLAVIDNRSSENASVFRVQSTGTTVHARVGTGSDVETIGLQVL